MVDAGTAAFKALAHPLRVRILTELGRRPATATMIAKGVGESTGSASYHLRQLARHGLVVEDETLGTARERWWRVADLELNLPPEVLFTDLPAAHVLTGSTLDAWYLEARDAVTKALNEGADGERANLTTLSRYSVVGTPEQLTAAFAQVEAIIQPLLQSQNPEPVDGAVRVTAQLIAFPEA